MRWVRDIKPRSMAHEFHTQSPFRALWHMVAPVLTMDAFLHAKSMAAESKPSQWSKSESVSVLPVYGRTQGSEHTGVASMIQSEDTSMGGFIFRLHPGRLLRLPTGRSWWEDGKSIAQPHMISNKRFSALKPHVDTFVRHPVHKKSRSHNTWEWESGVEWETVGIVGGKEE